MKNSLVDSLTRGLANDDH